MRENKFLFFFYKKKKIYGKFIQMWYNNYISKRTHRIWQYVMEENLKVVDIEKEKEEKIKENTARDTEAVLKEYEDTLGF